RDNRNWQRKLFARNVDQLTAIAPEYSWFIYPLLLAGLLLAGSAADPQPRRPLWILLSALLLYPVGYLFLHVLDRFLHPVPILLLLIGGFTVAAATRTAFWAGWGRGWILMAAIAATFMYDPANHLD